MNLPVKFLVLITLASLFSSCALPARMDGHSMQPALHDGDRFFYTFGTGGIKRGDIVLFRYPKDETKMFVKRVIGLPGEKVVIGQKKVFINGDLLDEPYVDAKLNYSEDRRLEMLIPTESYFVLRDNRNNSSDSSIWGPVKKELIVGKYWMTYAKSAE